MNSIIEQLPSTFNIIQEDNPELITVFRRGDFDSLPIDKMKIYVPEGISDDIPRSFVFAIQKDTTWIYRENVFIKLKNKQRPMTLKYVLENTVSNSYLIYVISRLGNIRRKLKEIEQQLKAIETCGNNVSGLIILTPEDLRDKILSINFPTMVFVSSYNRR